VSQTQAPAKNEVLSTGTTQQPRESISSAVTDSAAATGGTTIEEKLESQQKAQALLRAEKEAREQLLLTEELSNDTNLNSTPEPAVDEIMRKLRRADLERTWLAEAAQANAEPSQDIIERVDLPLELINSDDSAVSNSTILTALRLPPEIRPRSRDFGYLEAMPASFDVGGDGLFVEGSAQSHQRFQYVGRLGITATYTDILLGAGYYLTPRLATRMTVVLLAGIEHGDFELADQERAPGQTFNATDTGWHIGSVARFVVSSKFELSGGVGYSSFFEGDAQIFGGGYYHETPVSAYAITIDLRHGHE
jgi:hypothetical protein